MANNLVEIIFNQFLDILDKVANKKYCVDIDKCDYDFHERNSFKVQLIDVFTRVKGRCGSHKTVGITIDYTSICLEHLPTKKWKQYLKKLAHDLLAQIIEDKTFIIPEKEHKKKCRKQPKWCAFPTQCTTVITKRCEPKVVKPKCKVVFEKRCECIPVCKREKIQPKRKILIRCAPPVSKHCKKRRHDSDSDSDNDDWSRDNNNSSDDNDSHNWEGNNDWNDNNDWNGQDDNQQHYH